MPPDSSQPTGSSADAGSAGRVVSCTHCGLPVPRGLIVENSKLQFCCNGCKTVYEVIHACGLDRFYRLRDAAESEKQASPTTGRPYAEFDDPVFHNLYVKSVDDNLTEVEFFLEGVHCAACVWLVEKLPRVAAGVIEARLNMRRKLVRITWNPDFITLSRIAHSLDSLGYPPHPARDARSRELRKREDRRFLIRIGVAGAIAGNVMTLAFALYGGMFSGMEERFSTLFRCISMLLGLLSLLWPGSLFFRGAWAALKTRTAHLDLPIALGLVAGGIAGSVNTILGRGEVYFDSLTVLVFLLLVGRWIQHRQQRWAGDAVELLFSITPSSARLVEDAGIREVPIQALKLDDVVEVLAGDSIPVDGEVLEGSSAIDESLLSGESRPVEVSVANKVCAGAVNLSSPLRVRVEQTGESTRVGKLTRMVEEFSQRKAPIVQFADRVAGWFVVAVLCLAAATFVLWLWLDPPHAVDHAVALLIVTCPCALGLATPLAITAAIGRGARRGILIKGGAALELLARRGELLLDKTGTITEGRTALVRWRGDDNIKPLIAALEARSSHPLARAFVEAFGETELVATDVTQTGGGGVCGTVDGKAVAIGSPAYVQQHAAASEPWVAEEQQGIIDEALTPVLVSVDGRIVAAAGFGDPIREDAGETISALESLGWRVGILSGDHPDVVRAVAASLGLDDSLAFGGVSPEGKLEHVQAHARNGAVVMVGDGVNDAVALSAASVGVAVHGGAEASLAAADAHLSRPGLKPIVELIHAARRTVKIIRRCLAASLLYNLAAATLAIAGVISPLIAAILMPISSFTVLAMSFGSRTFGKE